MHLQLLETARFAWTALQVVHTSSDCCCSGLENKGVRFKIIIFHLHIWKPPKHGILLQKPTDYGGNTQCSTVPSTTASFRVFNWHLQEEWGLGCQHKERTRWQKPLFRREEPSSAAAPHLADKVLLIQLSTAAIPASISAGKEPPPP